MSCENLGDCNQQYRDIGGELIGDIINNVTFDECGEIFSEPYLRFKKQASYGYRISSIPGTRPEDLKTVKYSRGGIIRKFEEGGTTE